MPQYAAGTAYRSGWQFRPDFAYQAIPRTLDAGIRHIDTALVYRSQKQIGFSLGNAFASSHVQREDIFLTTKVFHPQFPGVLFPGDALQLDKITPEEVTVEVGRHVERCLHELNTGYLDLLLLHWPGDFDPSVDPTIGRARRLAAWKVLEETLENKWTRAIGVSNFSAVHLEQLVEDGATVRPMVNQIETSVFMRHEEIILYCEDHGIVVMAYSPLGSPDGGGKNEMLEDGELVRMADTYGMNTGHIALRYLVQRGFALTALSTSAHRLKSNLDVFSFSLSEEDMAVLDGLNKNKSMLGLVSPNDIS